MNTNAAKVLDALGDPTRRAIFERLARGPLSVGQLAKGLPVSRPAVSQHLRVLKEAGLATDQSIGNRRFYEHSREGLQALRDYLDGFWDRALDAFRTSAETESKHHQTRRKR